MLNKWHFQSLKASYGEQLAITELASRCYFAHTMPPAWPSYDVSVYAQSMNHTVLLQCKQTSDGRLIELSDFKFDYLVAYRFNDEHKGKRLHPETWIVPIAICKQHANANLQLALSNIPDEYKVIDLVQAAYRCTTPEQFRAILENAKDPWAQITNHLDNLDKELL